MSDSYEIKYDVTDFERGLGDLIKKLENRQPLMREMAAAMHDAVEENFAQQGRPEWAGWKSNAYWAKRRGGKILQKSGRLASSINEYSDNDSATVGTNVVYARIHQEGGTINIPARSQRAYYKQHKDGSVGNRFVKNRSRILHSGIRWASIKSLFPPVRFCISPSRMWMEWKTRCRPICNASLMVSPRIC